MPLSPSESKGNRVAPFETALSGGGSRQNSHHGSGIDFQKMQRYALRKIGYVFLIPAMSSVRQPTTCASL